MNVASIDDTPSSSSTADALAVAVRTSLDTCGRAYAAISDALTRAPKSTLNDRIRSQLQTLQGQLAQEITMRLSEVLHDAVAEETPVGDLEATDLRSRLRPVHAVLGRAGLLTKPDLIEAALLTIAEQQIVLRRDVLLTEVDDRGNRDQRADGGTVEAWLRDPSAPVAIALTQYLVERVARTDPYGNLGIPIADLDCDLAEALIWTAAASWRDDVRKVLQLDEVGADTALERAARRLTAAIDDERGEMSRATAAASVLVNSALVTSDSLHDILRAGETGLFFALLAELSGLSPVAARRLSLEPSRIGFALLCRVCGLSLEDFASMSARLQPAWMIFRMTLAPRGDELRMDPRAVFADVDEATVEIVLRMILRDPRYLAALARIGSES